MAKKRQLAPPHGHDVRPYRGTSTCNPVDGCQCGKQQTVKMRTEGLRFSWRWRVNLGGYWLGPELSLRSMSGAMRSGNAWARRMSLTAKWEE